MSNATDTTAETARQVLRKEIADAKQKSQRKRRGTSKADQPPVDDSEAEQAAGHETADGAALEDSELRAAQIVATRYGERVKFDVGRGQFLHHDGSHWERDTTGHVIGYIKAEAIGAKERILAAGYGCGEAEKAGRSLCSSKGVNAVKSLLATEPGIPVKPEALDTDRFALNCKNGTVDLRTGELRPHDPADLITRVVPFNYYADARCPLFDGHIATILRKPGLAQYVQRIIGLAASGDIGVEELYVFHGSGANGKSKLMDACRHALGPYAGTAPESLLISRHGAQEHPTELANLQGKRLVIASETEEGGTLRLQLIKRLTGDATIIARFMRQDYFEFPRTHKMILVTNNKPKVMENSEAAWRRLRLVPFVETIPTDVRDENFGTKLEAEAEGILAWIVRGSIDRIRNGMQPPPCVLEATETYRVESDAFGDFVETDLLVGPDLWCSRRELFEHYDAYCKKSGDTALTDQAFYHRIRSIEGVIDDRRRVLGQPTRGFRGVALLWKHGQEAGSEERANERDTLSPLLAEM